VSVLFNRIESCFGLKVRVRQVNGASASLADIRPGIG
jgi:hypothetical protein